MDINMILIRGYVIYSLRIAFALKLISSLLLLGIETLCYANVILYYAYSFHKKNIKWILNMFHDDAAAAMLHIAIIIYMES